MIMKSPLGKLLNIFGEGEMRRNARALRLYAAFLIVVILLYTTLFQLIMVQVEGQSHSWVTAIYWTLVTMSTLGFGDVTFSSDIGRLFSLAVLMSGILLLLVVLPFTFIRFFYSPWLEAQLKRRAPRKVPPNVRDHVIITRYDAIAAGLIERLLASQIPYYVVESDPKTAGHLLNQDLSVINGELDNRTTYEDLQVQQARLLFTNCEDTTNTNITLTVREVSGDVPVISIAEQEDSIDILELSGSTHVLPLKVRLGEYLANRVSAIGEMDIIGNFRGLRVAEVSVRNTPLANLTVSDTRLRERTGLNVVGIWYRGRLTPAFPQTLISNDSILVVAGVSEQLDSLNKVLNIRSHKRTSVMVIGAGTIGRVATRTLKDQGVSVHLVESNPAKTERLKDLADHVVIGNANDRNVLERAGLKDVSAVLLTTNDDAINVYLTVYCRRLKPDLRIASRVTHDRNLEAVYRAGADFVLSYMSLGVESIMSLIEGHEPLILGEGIELFEMQLPASLENKTLAETGIASRTGLSLVAVQTSGKLVTRFSASMQLMAGDQLSMLGSLEQRRKFAEIFD
jgi:Trk K+ transport system NAD-binding subunit